MTEAYHPYLTLPDNGSARHSRTTTGRPYANAALLRVETGSDQRLRYVASAVPYHPLKRSIKGNPRSIVGYGIYDVPQNDGRCVYRKRAIRKRRFCQAVRRERRTLHLDKRSICSVSNHYFLPCQHCPHFQQYLLLSAGDLHLRGAQALGGLLLGLVGEVTQLYQRPLAVVEGGQGLF